MMSAEKINYTAFASFLSSFPDTFAVKRFRELQIRNLLFYQAELAHLQVELEEIEQIDARNRPNGPERATFRWTPSMAKDASLFTSASIPTNSTTSSLYSEKIFQIRNTLEKYSQSNSSAQCKRPLTFSEDSAVEQYKRLNDISCPKRSDMRAICQWLSGMNRGGSFLAGDVEDVWNVQVNPHEYRPAGVDDFYGFEEKGGLAFSIGAFSAFLQRLFCRGSGSEQPHHIDTSASGALDKALSTVIASVLPIIPIVAFYFVQRLLVRIGLILAFTAAFAAILVVGMQLKPDTTLGITTA